MSAKDSSNRDMPPVAWFIQMYLLCFSVSVRRYVCGENQVYFNLSLSLRPSYDHFQQSKKYAGHITWRCDQCNSLRSRILGNEELARFLLFWQTALDSCREHVFVLQRFCSHLSDRHRVSMFMFVGRVIVVMQHYLHGFPHRNENGDCQTKKK